MQLIRFRAAGGAPRVGVLEDGEVRGLPGIGTMADLLALPVLAVRELCTGQAAGDPPFEPVRFDPASLLAPLDGRTEVWAAGVTYERSRSARVQESLDSADIYEQGVRRGPAGAVLQVGRLAGGRAGRPGQRAGRLRR